MEYARLETALLEDVTDDYYYGCSCTSCLHTARLSLSKLRAHLGGDFPLRKIRERLKYQICSSRKVSLLRLAGPFVLLHSPGDGESEAQRSQWVIETLASSVYAGVFHCRVCRGRAFNFLATVSNWA
jgi:hypothetical protein